MVRESLARLQVIGRLHEHGCRGPLIRRAPAEVLQPWDRTAVIMLEPNLPQALQRGEDTRGRRALIAPDPLQELIAIRADLQGQGLTFPGLFGQAPSRGTEAIAIVPLARHPLTHPCGIDLTELVERMMHGFQDTC